MLRSIPTTKPIPEMSPSDINRFMEKCEISDYPEQCIIWVGSKNKKGYGQFKLDKKTHAAHRVAYTIYNGVNSLIPNMIISQLCGRPACVHVDHIKQMTMVEHRNNPKQLDIRIMQPNALVHVQGTRTLDTNDRSQFTMNEVERVQESKDSKRTQSTRNLYEECFNHYKEYSAWRGWDNVVTSARVQVFLQYLSDGLDENGIVVKISDKRKQPPYSRSYIENHYKALRYHFEELEYDKELIELMKGIRRNTKSNNQITGLNIEDIEELIDWARDHPELDGTVDLYTPTLISFLHDTLLRPSECIAARWSELVIDRYGGATIYVPKSKTDQLGEGREARINPKTIDLMREHFGDSFDKLASSGDDDDFNGRIWGIGHTSTLRRYIKSFIKQGLANRGGSSKIGRFSGYSTRVGAVQDMVIRNVSHENIMKAGGWIDPRMPALYSRKQTLIGGATDQLHDMRDKEKRREQEEQMKMASDAHTDSERLSDEKFIDYHLQALLDSQTNPHHKPSNFGEHYRYAVDQYQSPPMSQVGRYLAIALATKGIIDKLPGEIWGHSVYKLIFPCGAEYVGRTSLNIMTRVRQHIGLGEYNEWGPTYLVYREWEKHGTFSVQVLGSDISEDHIHTIERVYIAGLERPLNTMGATKPMSGCCVPTEEEKHEAVRRGPVARYFEDHDE